MVNNKGNVVANQFIIRQGDIIVFQSYRSQIATYSQDTQILKVFSDWDYSRTTLKYFKQFVNEETSFTYENKKQFEQLMKENKNIIEVL